MIKFKHKGNLEKTTRFFKRMKEQKYLQVLEKYAQAGVEALSSATPVDSGATASCWNYEIEKGDGRYSIYWTNTNENQGVPIAIILQLGHGTGTGGYVQGRDYINPVMQQIFDNMAEDVWKEVRSL